MKPEAKVKQQVKALLAEFGAKYVMPIGSTYGSNGEADFIACVGGLYLAIETKATASDKLTALQEAKRRDTLRAGGVSLVIHIDNLHHLREVLTLMLMKAALRESATERLLAGGTTEAG